MQPDGNHHRNHHHHSSQYLAAHRDCPVFIPVTDRLTELRAEYGRSGDPFQIHVISMDGYSRDGLLRLEDLGVTDAIVGFRNGYEGDDMTLQDKIDAVNRYADKVISTL